MTAVNMKGYLISVVLLLVCRSAIIAGQTECGIYADSLAHPTDCTKYYKLNQISCPDGLLYNKYTKQCVAPENSTCSDLSTAGPDTTPDTNTTPSTNSTQSSPSTVTTQTSPSTDITQTMPTTDITQTMPTTDITQTMPTTDITQTTPTTNVTETTPSTITTNPTPTSTQASTTSGLPVETTTSSELPLYSCPAVDDPNTKIRYAHETNCQYYYLCVNGATTLYTCTSTHHFNPISRICQPINQAGCDRCPDVEVAGVVVRLPHETVCQYYYICSTDGSTAPYTCAGETLFSRIERKCLPPSEARCTLLAAGEP